MSAIADEALALAALGIQLIPVSKGTKIPAFKNWPQVATADPIKLHEWFDNEDYNSGIRCGLYPNGLYLVAIDIDNGNGKNGSKTIDGLKSLGFDFPPTWMQKTPNGGFHMLYWSSVPIRQGVSVLGEHIDIRCSGGQILGPKSIVNGKSYEVVERIPFAHIPLWIQEGYAKPELKATVLEFKPKLTAEGQVLSLNRAVEYLQSRKPSGEGTRNNSAFLDSCRLKDMGVDETQIPHLIMEYRKLIPMLEFEELQVIAASAFNTGVNTPGCDTPEAVFDKVPVQPKEKDFIDEMNEKYFYCPNVGVCEEKHMNGVLSIAKYNTKTFHELLLSETIKIEINDRIKTLKKSEEWMKSPKRRTYSEIRFIPKNEVDTKTFNLWRGFKVKPHHGISPEKARIGFDKFIQHIKENICDGNEKDFEWLMDYLCHMFQKPWEKPSIAIVLSGDKGTGKNIFIDVLKHLIGPYSATISNNKALSSQFNSIMEDKILVAFDEAFWSGDRSVEGTLKSLITDDYRWIERKGSEKYETRVYDRIFILGNEDRLVNATRNERRYVVFNVSDRRMQDSEFFGDIIEGTYRSGGDGLLMTHFMSRNISNFNHKKFHTTQGVLDQKVQSLLPIEQWWMECLKEGRILGTFEGGEWPKVMSSKDFINTFLKYEKDQISGRYSTSRFSVGKHFKKIAPSCSVQKSIWTDGGSRQFYSFCDLDTARKEWNIATKLETKWD